MTRIDTYERLDELIESSLKELMDWLAQSFWIGRERELISLYVLGYLVPRCRDGQVVSDPTQIGIGVAVPEPASMLSNGAKRDVSKDVVIWSQPRTTCWQCSGGLLNYPLSVLAWRSFNFLEDSEEDIKTKRSDYDRDIHWLIDASKALKEFVGYSVLVDQPEAILSVARVQFGELKRDWVVYDAAA